MNVIKKKTQYKRKVCCFIFVDARVCAENEYKYKYKCGCRAIQDTESWSELSTSA
jgi:hypothetical protein